jgi:hypothetical protein
VKVALSVPTTVGVKASVNVQVVLAGTLPPTPATKLQVLLWIVNTFAVPLAKYALLISIGVDPAFWKVTTPVLVLPIGVFAKVNVAGVTFTAVACPLISSPSLFSV